MDAEELSKIVEEHQEHEDEGKLTPFDRHVAMTMVIIAAVLAVITLLSHRADSEALKLQVEANSLRTEANIYHTRASDQWAYYQAKNIRSTEYQGFLGLLDALSKEPMTGDHKSLELQEQWGAEVRKYEGVELPQLKASAEQLVKQAIDFEGRSGQAIHRSLQATRRGERLDLAELAVELALVLCSVAVLTKDSRFWYAGIGAGGLGSLIALFALI
jgi:type II secretory pathway pseudopilin PulG